MTLRSLRPGESYSLRAATTETVNFLAKALVRQSCADRKCETRISLTFVFNRLPRSKTIVHPCAPGTPDSISVSRGKWRLGRKKAAGRPVAADPQVAADLYLVDSPSEPRRWSDTHHGRHLFPVGIPDDPSFRNDRVHHRRRGDIEYGIPDRRTRRPHGRAPA